MSANLRKQAELWLKQNPLADTAGAQRIVRDLLDYQRELEVQNEELRATQSNPEATHVGSIEINERLQAEQALKEKEQDHAVFNRQNEILIEQGSAEQRDSEERFRILFEEGPDPCFLFDPYGRVIDMNKAMESMLGYAREELIGQTLLDSKTLPTSYLPVVNERLRRLAQGHKAEAIEYGLLGKDGTEISVELTSTPIRLQGQTLTLSSARDLTQRENANLALRASEARFRSTINSLQVGVVVHAPDTTVLLSNPQASYLLGLSAEQLMGWQPIPADWHFIYQDGSVVEPQDYPLNRVVATGKSFAYECMGVQRPGCADVIWLTGSAIPVFTEENVLDRIVVNFMDVTEIKRLQDALQKRVLALTHPLDQPEGIAFEDLFNLPKIQHVQDAFSAATGVASMIVDSQGEALTEPSNLVEMPGFMDRNTKAVYVEFFTSNAEIVRHHPEGPVIRQCPGSGLWDAGASIAIGGRHIATWLIGQARDESWSKEQAGAYAREIGADEAQVLEAFSRRPVMTREHFEDIAQALFTLATQLSTSAYQNVQQARFIAGQKVAEQAMHESEEKYRKLFESESDAIMIFDGATRQFIDVNEAAVQLYGYTRDEFLQLKQPAVTAEPEVAEEVIPAVLSQGTAPRLETRHRKKDGSVFPTEITAFSFFLKGRKVICGVVRDSTERIAYEYELENNHEELRQLASELSLARQRERERIGREIHDGLSQLLSSSLLHLNILNDSLLPKAAVAALDTVIGILNEALVETRSLTFELSCPMLNELGLAAALEELCSSMRHEYSLDFEFKGAMAPLPISMDSKIALYRSTRELLINVMKHSQAKWACVQLEQTDGCVHISVEDNGVGFDADMAGKGFSPTGGFGLFSIREFILHTDGNLQIESTPGAGTQVRLTVPLEESHE